VARSQPPPRQRLRANHRLGNRVAVHRLNPTPRPPHRKSMKSIAIVLNQTLKQKRHKLPTISCRSFTRASTPKNPAQLADQQRLDHRPPRIAQRKSANDSATAPLRKPRSNRAHKTQAPLPVCGRKHHVKRTGISQPVFQTAFGDQVFAQVCVGKGSQR